MLTRKGHADFYPGLSELAYWEFEPETESGPWRWMYLIQVGDLDFHISGAGVSIEHEDGSSTRTNITPRTLFPMSKWGLSDEQLVTLITMPREGASFTKEEMDDLYQEYLRAKERGEAD